MASARELLEQADALMRRNRSRGGVDIPVLTDIMVDAPQEDDAASDVPVLTDVVATGAVVGARPAPDPAPLLERGPAPPPSPRGAAGDAIRRAADSIPVDLPMEGDTSDWLVMDTIDPAVHSITGIAPDTLAVVPPVTLKATGSEPTPLAEGGRAGTVSAPAIEPTTDPAPVSPPPAPGPSAEELAAREASALADAEAARAARTAAEDERWRALAEQVSMQVLQRVDLFTDTGLKPQLAQHLQPIVERASAELVGAITDHVGGLLRSYVAEAIEREIAQWRRDH